MKHDQTAGEEVVDALRDIIGQDDAQVHALAQAIRRERDAFDEDSIEIGGEDEAPEESDSDEVAMTSPNVTAQDVIASLVGSLADVAAMTVIVTDRAGNDHVLQTTMPPAYSAWHENVLRAVNVRRLLAS
jgi:hypothetical protein